MADSSSRSICNAGGRESFQLCSCATVVSTRDCSIVTLEFLTCSYLYEGQHCIWARDVAKVLAGQESKHP